MTDADIRRRDDLELSAQTECAAQAVVAAIETFKVESKRAFDLLPADPSTSMTTESMDAQERAAVAGAALTTKGLDHHDRVDDRIRGMAGRVLPSTMSAYWRASARAQIACQAVRAEYGGPGC